ncbi:coiled-coil domain-containing protein [[Ruminococcus] torques]|uniref:coiled-coil domain-containing protein n=1 Tax=[Ruminococcus] torques TaxID=33039 RepID=UPI00307B5E5D
MMLLCGEIDNKMRKGGSMRLKKVHSTFLTAALACSLAVTPVFANPAEDAENLKNQKTEAESELSNLQTQFDTLIQKANELELKLIKTGEAIIQAQADLEAAEEKKEEQYEAMKKRIKFMYESGTGSATVEKVMTSGDMSSMLSQAEYSQKMHEYDREQLKEYTNTVTEIENLQKTLEEEQKNLEATEKEYEAEQATLTETINSKKDEITNLDGMIQEAARKAEEERKAGEERRRREEEAKNNVTPEQPVTPSNPNNGSSGGSGAAPYDPVTGNVIVDRAYGCIGLPYVWGATGPNSFDCSGLVGYCLTGGYGRVGTTYTFMGWPRVSDPQPGDVCTNWDHCGIYIGNGMMIHAPQPGENVKIGPVQAGMVYVRR